MDEKVLKKGFEQEQNIQSGMMSTDVLLITGKRGTGKTFFGKYYIKTFLLDKIKTVVFDPLWQYGDLGKVTHNINDIKRVKDKGLIIYEPISEIDTPEHFDELAHMVFEMGNCVFVAEEVNEYIGDYQNTPKFRRLIRRGRNRGIGVICTSQRPKYLSTNFIAAVDHWFIFRQDLKVDLDRIFEYLERANPDYNQDFVAALPNFHYLHKYVEKKTGKNIVIACKPVKDTAKAKIITKPEELFEF